MPDRPKSSFLLWIFLVLVSSAPWVGAQENVLDLGSIRDPQTGLVRAVAELVIEPVDLREGWLEVTPLALDVEAAVFRVEDRSEEDGELRFPPAVPKGAAMLCSGGRALAVLCEQVYLSGELWVDVNQSADVPVRFEQGLAVTGRYLLAGWPVKEARVAVVPAGIVSDRPFTMPLGLAKEEQSELRREVPTDEDGRFKVPRLAEGEYFLETLLPSGRLHRSETFLLPEPRRARRESLVAGVRESRAESSVETGESQVETDESLGSDPAAVWDLGVIDVAAGLVVAFEVADPEGRPLAGARVTGRQGATPESLINFEAITDPSGAAKLSGFAAEDSVNIQCRKPGYRGFHRDYPLLPVLVTCVLEPLARVSGEVLGIDGVAPAEAVVSVELVAVVRPPDSAPDAAEPRPVPPVAIDSEGAFSLGDLIAGEYTLHAAAPGFEAAQRTFVVEPGQRLPLEPIILSFGRELEGRVVDRNTRKPIPQVEIRAISPPGAVLVSSNEEGQFNLVSVREQSLVLRLVAEGYADREIALSRQQLSGRGPLVFEMERGGRIRVIVWDEASDVPCQSCRLVVRPTAQELSTDGLGEALSATVAPGEYRVYRPRVTHLGSSVVAETEAEMRSVRVRAGRVSKVRFGERRRTIRVAFDPLPGAGWTLSARSARRSERYRRRSDGSFHVRQKAGESLDLYLHRYDVSASAEVEIRQTTLPEGFLKSELVVPLRGGTLSGRATESGEPVAGIDIRLVTLHTVETWATAKSRPDGTFVLPNVPGGVYSVFIGQRSVQIASLRPGQALDLGSFQLTPGSY